MKCSYPQVLMVAHLTPTCQPHTYLGSTLKLITALNTYPIHFWSLLQFLALLRDLFLLGRGGVEARRCSQDLRRHLRCVVALARAACVCRKLRIGIRFATSFRVGFGVDISYVSRYEVGFGLLRRFQQPYVPEAVSPSQAQTNIGVPNTKRHPPKDRRGLHAPRRAWGSELLIAAAVSGGMPLFPGQHRSIRIVTIPTIMLVKIPTIIITITTRIIAILVIVPK